ncbi:retrovirus-related pol polyprotein from transposon TNT 1-94 [Tanacetum coccineum]
MSSHVSNRTVNTAEPPRNQNPFLKSKDLACPTCKKYIYSANHDECILKYLSTVNSRAFTQKKDAQSYKTTKRYILVEKKSDCKNHGRQIPIGQRFSPNKSSNVYLKTTPPRSSLTWKPMGRIFTQVGLKWIPIRKSVETRYNTNDSTSMASEPISSNRSSNVGPHGTKEGADLLTGSKDTNVYTLSLADMMRSSPISLLSKASKTKSWLWHRRKSKKHTYKPKSKDSIQEKLYLLYMDPCGPMRIESINGKKYILVIVDDYSRNIGTDNRTEFVNQTLKSYFEDVRISLQNFVARTPQQNAVVERQNRTLVEVARKMLIFSKAPLYLWAEAVAMACYTQNRSLIRKCHNKTPYELLHDKTQP